jgi:hypothetical protein
MTSTIESSAPSQLPAELQESWNDIVRHTCPEPVFEPELARRLPSAAQRWLLRAVAPGTPLRRSVELDLHGSIKLGGWRDFTARQVLTVDQGYIWAERTHLLGLPVEGFDRFTDGIGEMKHWTVGHVPVMTAEGEDVTISAAGRMAAELTYLPSFALDDKVSWTERDRDTAVATVRLLGHRHVVTLTVWPNGEPRRISLDRWSQVGGRRFRMHRFVADLGSVRRFDGYAIPTWVRAGYADPRGRMNAFIEQITDHATFH